VKNLLRILVVIAAGAPQFAHACAACMGDPNSNIAKGANAAIFVMLGLLAGVFALVGAFIYNLYRRSKMPLPPHAELGETLNVKP
jgi:hypothetical protein